MRTNYPEDYKGPKAGGSSDEEWLTVTEFQAFRFVRLGAWYYSDFDCWLIARDKHYYNLGRDAMHKASSQEFDKCRQNLCEIHIKNRNNVEDFN